LRAAGVPVPAETKKNLEFPANVFQQPSVFREAVVMVIAVNDLPSATSTVAVSANRYAAQPLRRKSREQIAGISRRPGLRGQESPYPLRT
jgi:hypothetical protein